MTIESSSIALGKIIATQIGRIWVDVRVKRTPKADLADQIALSRLDHFQKRKAIRQIEDVADMTIERLTPLLQVEYPDLPPNEREAALLLLVDAFAATDLSDHILLASNLDPGTLTSIVSEQISPKRRNDLAPAARTLLDALIRETCGGFAHIVTLLPEFQARSSVETLTRLARMGSQLEEALSRLPPPRITDPSENELDAAFLRRYEEHISTNLDELELFGVDVRNYRPRSLVSVAYLNLSVSGDVGHRVVDDLSHNSDADSPSRPTNISKKVDAAVADSTRILLRGEAGSGKTTLLQWIAVNCVRRTFSGSLATWNGATPFLVRLRDYSDGALPRPEDIIQGTASMISNLMPSGWIHRFLESNSALLIDGVDELLPAHRPRVRKWLREIISNFPNVRLIVTSRPGAANHQWLQDEGFTSLFLEPMSYNDVEQFCDRWHEAIREAALNSATKLPCEIEELDEYRAAVLRHFTTQNHLRSLATSPLLCAMICALNLDRRKSLPPDRMALYQAALELLLDRRDLERDVPASRAVILTTSAKIAILQHIAWRITLAGRAQLDIERVQTHVATALERMPNVTTSAPETTRFLIERSGLLREPRVGFVDFIHRTFQEYLAAKEAVGDHELDFLINNAHIDQWTETIVMGAGHATPDRRAQLINGILERSRNEPRHSRRLKLLAAACLDTSTVLEPTTAKTATDELSTLIPPRNGRESQSLASAGERILELLPTTTTELTEASASATVRCAALVGGPNALPLIRSYCADERFDVQREIARSWRYFDTSQFTEEVMRFFAPTTGFYFCWRPVELPELVKIERVQQVNAQFVGEPMRDLSILEVDLPLQFLFCSLAHPAEIPKSARISELLTLNVTG